jgi:hypothetical protein
MLEAPVVARAQAAEFTYKYANNLPDTHPMNIRAREMAAAIKTETNGCVANTSCSLRGFSDVPYGASPNVMRYGGNPSSKERAACRSVVAKPSVNRS